MLHRRHGGSQVRRDRRDRRRQCRRVEPDSAKAWRSQDGLHDEGTPSRGYRPRPTHDYDTPTGQDCPDQAATSCVGRGLRQGPRRCAALRSRRHRRHHRPTTIGPTRHAALYSTSEDRRRVGAKNPLRCLARMPRGRSPASPQKTSRIRGGNTTAITRRFVFGPRSTPQKKGTPAVGGRRLHRTSSWTKRAARSHLRIG